MEYLKELQNDVLVYGFVAIIFELVITEIVYSRRLNEIDAQFDNMDRKYKKRSEKSWLSIKETEKEFIKPENKSAA